MKIQTMSVVVGSTACNAKCPFCVSKQTPTCEIPKEPNWRNFGIALSLADKSGATTILLTGKGEPTLYPKLITDYLGWMIQSGYHFPFIEMQTNGIRIGEGSVDNYLNQWYDLGLTTVALSAVDIWGDKNRLIYGKEYPDLKETVKILIGYGFTVRLSIMMLKGYVDSRAKVDNVAEFCQINGIKQLTIRPIAKTEANDNEITKWVNEHTLSDEQLKKIVDHVNYVGTPVLHLAHGAVVYDYRGQNLCLSNCLTTNDTDDNMRQIIFYPDGTIGYDWKYKGAVLL